MIDNKIKNLKSEIKITTPEEIEEKKSKHEKKTKSMRDRLSRVLICGVCGFNIDLDIAEEEITTFTEFSVAGHNLAICPICQTVKAIDI